MDADFEQHYQAAERAYGLREYAEAHALTSALWDQLQSASNEHDPGLIMSWRAVVSLLLGHIQLHGLQNRSKPPSPTNGCWRVTWTPPSPPWRNRD